MRPGPQFAIKRVMDPDSQDIDVLVHFVEEELRRARVEVRPEAVAARLAVPVATIAQHWPRLHPGEVAS